MAIIDFSEHERRNMVSNIQNYFREELDQDIGGLTPNFCSIFLPSNLAPCFITEVCTMPKRCWPIK